MMIIRTHIISRNTLTLMLCLLSVLAIVPVAYGEVHRVSGDVMGRWISGDTFIVTGDIEVPADTSLRIDPDVSVLFEGNYIFRVNGSLIAVNGVEVGQSIEFSGIDGRDWVGIWFRSGGHDNSILSGCTIYNAWVGVDIQGTSPSIFENTIHALTVGIICENTRSDISGNIIIVGEGTSSQDLTGVLMTNEANGLVKENYIRINSNLFGVLIGIKVVESRPIIQDNYIDVETIGEGYGIYTLTVTKLELVRNIIRTTSPNRMTAVCLYNSTGVMVLNNTFHLMGRAASAWGLRILERSDILIINNIILGNTLSIGIYSAEGTVSESSGYNDVWRHDTNYIGDYQGDEETDISADPLIRNATPKAESGEDYELIWEYDDENHEEVRSPCIDAGSPNWQDPDDTNSDMGAVYFDHNEMSDNDPDLQLMKINPDRFELLDVYPNPFNSYTLISLIVENPISAKVCVYNYLGQSVEQLWDGQFDKGSHILKWSPNNISSGTYFIRFESGGQLKIAKLSYLR